MTTQAIPLDDLVARLKRPATTGNALRDIDPLAMLICTVALAIASFLLPTLVGPLVMIVLVVLLGVLGGIGRTFLPSYAKLCLAVGLILFVLRAVFSRAGEPWIEWGPFMISAEGLVAAADFTFMILAVCGWLTLFFALVPMPNLMLALERAGASPKASYVVLGSFQAIADLGGNTRTVMDAQRSRGIETEGSLARRARAFVPVITPVFLTAMAQTEERALALDARAFNAPNAHTHLVELRRFGIRDILTIVLGVAVLVFAIVGKVALWH